MERTKTISEALAKQAEAMGNLQQAQELAKDCIKKIKKMQREWLHEQKQWMKLGWNKPIPSKPIRQQKAAPTWYRVRSFCQRRRPSEPNC